MNILFTFLQQQDKTNVPLIIAIIVIIIILINK